jgi:uncharacterized protein (TIGR02145 family)
MKNRKDISIYLIILMGLFLVFTSSCENDDEYSGGIPVLTTTAVTYITQTTSISGGIITSDEGSMITIRGVCWSTSQNPTITDNKTTDGTGLGDFTSGLIGLVPGTTYYVRAYATNSGGTGYGNSISFTTEPSSSFTDPRDGNVYKTVTIGSQVWMAENLKYLPSVVSATTTSYTTPYYYVYDYDGTIVSEAKATGNYNTYGVLYNWEAAKKACPAGWHLPNLAEFTLLITYLGGESASGGKLKEPGSTHWSSPNTGATNETGFTALPGGWCGGWNPFDHIGFFGYLWSATANEPPHFRDAWCLWMQSETSSALIGFQDMTIGYSVRCVRD